MDEKTKSVKTFLEENKRILIGVAVGLAVVGAGALVIKFGVAKSAAEALTDGAELVSEATTTV